MLDFVAGAFRSWMNVVLWIVLIGCAIGGVIIGRSFFYFEGAGILGFFVGGFVGLIINILWGGFIANFLNMVDNIAKIANRQNKE
jgi:hypothetical protein